MIPLLILLWRWLERRFITYLVISLLMWAGFLGLASAIVKAFP